MAKFTLRLSRWAEQDLVAIAEYTLDTWGERQVSQCADLLERGCTKITRRSAHSRQQGSG